MLITWTDIKPVIGNFFGKNSFFPFLPVFNQLLLCSHILFADHLLWKELFSGFVLPYPRFPFMWNVATTKPQEKLVQSILFWMTVDIWISYEKNISGLYGSWTHHLCDTGAVLYQLGARHFVGSYLIREVMFITAFPSDQLFNQFSEKTESGGNCEQQLPEKAYRSSVGQQCADCQPTGFFYGVVLRDYPLSSRRAREYVSTWVQKQFKLVCLPL